MTPDVTRTRSLALLGHGGDGKTTLADAVLLAAAVTSRLGSVQDGTSFMNHLPEERRRRLSISTGICSFEHAGSAWTLLDAPGDANFAGEAHGAAMAADCALLVLGAADGVRLGAHRALALARERGLALAAIATKMDLEQADYERCAQQLEEAAGRRVVRLHLPLDPGPGLRGYIDLLTRKAHVFEGSTGKAKITECPAALAADMDAAREALVEAAAEADDAALERYLEEGELPDDAVLAALRMGVREGTLIPLLCASGARAIGGAAVLALAEQLLPSPAERAPLRAQAGERELALEPHPGGPLVAYVWKSIADRYTGMLSLVRVVSGTLRPDLAVSNARTGTRERICKILALCGESARETGEVGPGQLAALPKLKDTRTGDTLCGDEKHLVHIAPPALPPSAIAFAVQAVNPGEEDKVFESLHRLVEEDPTLALGRDERTGEFLLGGLGQLHLEVTLEKLARIFHVAVQLKPPKVPYQETLRGRAQNVEGKLKKQSGGRGQFAVCYLSVEPGPRGSGVVFLDEIVGGAIPRNYIPAVERGVRETCERGILAGFPVTDVRVHCTDGKFHAVDSSEQAFRIAGSLAMKAAFAQAEPVLLEPVMKLQIGVPDEFVGDIMGNLHARRGRVSGVEAAGPASTIGADVPMAEVLSYASDLTHITGGQGSFTMEFSHYEEVPKEVQERIVAEVGAQRASD